ncbi:hypothetical protein PMAYCL1PPCAC_20618 [Pristionchus mayeri]|uniref:Delta(3,5)-Delta(2,4)-dienoyl-CoA isomerase, mitochondrial n=1 Tax=Pristionchus mayeri TaxID=1317129 RepID=A0AAN5CTG1_9BILA|nr:hypothetical protein PMAYCL1PPCAC_20618 [Pristionchus mayeri]
MQSTRIGYIARFISTSRQRLADIEVTEASPYVYHVKLDKPKKRNAFIPEMWKELRKISKDLSANPKCRSIVISGEGKSFCAGIDLQEGFGEVMNLFENDNLDAARKGRILREFIRIPQDGFTALESCYKPIIVAVHSHCIGAGIDLITACDIRLAAKDAVFSIKEVDVGLAADVGTLARIQKVVGNDSITRELALTARNFDAEEALRYGLISKIYPDQATTVAAALEMAAAIAAKSPIAVQGTKVNLNYGRDHTVKESLDYILAWNMSQLNTEDLMKSAMATMSKEKAEFNDV